MIGFTFNNYWLALGLIQVGYFILLVVKYFIVSYITLKSNEKLHNNMLLSLLRSPTQYFDTTPTGRLINRFSNDLNVLDSLMAYIFIDTIEGPILALVLLFIIPAFVTFILQALWFVYCKRTII
jgi:ABC-type multidrug transport system fused ATPase/permease subunit